MADVKAVLFEDGKFQAVGNNGQVVPYGKLYFYDSISGDKVDTYTTSTMETKNEWPIILTASGKGDVYITDGQFDVTLQDKHGAPVWTINNFIPAGGETPLSPTAAVPTKEEFTGVVGSSIVLEGTPLTTVDTHKNGLILNTDEYILDGRTITFVDPLVVTDEIVIEFSKIIADSGNQGVQYTISTISDLLILDVSYGKVIVSGYSTENDKGGGLFSWNSAADKSAADAGMIIDPSVSLALQGTGVGEGCWVRNSDGTEHVAAFGAIGNGITDDTAALIAADLSIGVNNLMFDNDGIYLVSQLPLTSSKNFYTNGAIFKSDGSLTSTSPVVVITSNNASFDMINIDNTGTELAKFRMLAVGPCDNIVVGEININATLQVASASSLSPAVRLFEIANSKIGKLNIENFDFGVYAFGSNDALSIGKVSISSYVNGLNIQAGKNITIGGEGGIKITTRSPNAGVVPGHNGILIGNNSGVNFGTSNVSMIDMFIRNSGEHGIRIAGDNHTHRVKLIRPDIAQAGGSCIKFLTGLNGVYAYEPLIDNPLLADALEEGIKLSCGIIAYRIIDGVINNPVIKAKDHLYCGQHGISLYNISGLIINNPNITGAREHGISVRLEHGDGGEGAGTQVAHDVNILNIQGGYIALSGLDGINFPAEGRQHRALTINGTLLRANSQWGISLTSDGVPSAGQFDNAYINTKGDSNVSGHLNIDAAVGLPSQIMLALQDQFNNETNAANGSTWHDRAAGQFKVLKAGVWTAI